MERGREVRKLRTPFLVYAAGSIKQAASALS
jgi:hypothetical protein